MDFGLYLRESLFGSLSSIISMAKVIIPLMMTMEILKDLRVLEKLSLKMKPIAKFFEISDEAVFPLIIGLIFGLAYGAGVIIESVKENDLPKKDLYVIMIFLVACHAVIEDTLIFVVIGANLWLLLGLRLGAAIILAYFVSKLFARHETNLIKAKQLEKKGA